MKKKLISLTTALIMLLSALPLFTFAAETEVFATRGQVADMLLGASDDCVQGLQRSDIIKGYEDGTTREEQYITRAEAFVMLNRAFAPLPEPVGNDLRLSEQQVSFTQVPDWAADDVQQLVKAGIVVGTPDGTLQADELVTVTQMDTMIRRVWQLFGSNLKDDFYSTVNKEALDSSVISGTDAASNAFSQLDAENQERLNEIISEMRATPQASGSKEQKIVDFYNSILDIETRNTLGIQPIKKYLDAIDAAQTLDELAEAEALLAAELLPVNLFNFGLSTDLKDSTQYALYFSTVSPGLSKSQYESEGDVQTAYMNYLTELLVLSGEEAETAAAAAQSYYDFEKELAAAMYETQEYSDVDKIYNVYTMDELSALLPQEHLEQALANMGLRAEDQIIVQDPGLLQAFAAHYRDEEIELMKTSAKLQVLFNFGAVLNQEFEEASFDLQKVLTGVQTQKSIEERASVMTQNVMSDYLGELFAERYCSPEIKADVEAMVQSFLTIYKDRIQNLDWMSAATKDKAIQKLDAMEMKVGYPDTWETPMDEVEIIGPQADQNAYFLNVCAITHGILDYQSGLQGQPVDKTQWACSVFEVNAFYNFTTNDITLPAGILQPPFYDSTAPEEANLGAIGTVIAHEITHAFDNNGAKFDENGNAADWWTAEDYQKFQELCAEVIAHYDGYEAAPGIANNGTLTLSENIADMGGIACALDAMAQLPDPDYDAFFRSNAKMWCMSATRPYQQMLNLMDVHSANKIRVNRGLTTVDQFFETYQIEEGDGMYVAPADRISIW